jgi:hypothetical protein
MAAAALILGEFSVGRTAGMALVGGLIYALEIPRYFRWIDRRVPSRGTARSTLARGGLAMLYFNPVWIARHLLFIRLFSGRWNDVSWALLGTGLASWAANVPLSLLGNLVIQNALPYRWRFLASALFSALMAVYYAVSAVWFG